MVDSVYDPRCKEIQHHDGVRFAAIINHNGEKIAGGFTEGVAPYEGDEAKLHDFYKFALTVSLRTDELNNSLGALNYIASRRDKVILISFPFPCCLTTFLKSSCKKFFVLFLIN